MELQNKTIAIMVAPKFQDDEALSPYRFLKDMGAEVSFIGLQRGHCKGKGQTIVEVEMLVQDVHPDQFDGLIIPGGSSPETLRLNKEVLELVRFFMNNAKPLGAICHGPQVLISAGVIRGRTLTCYPGIRDDVILAGARYIDQEVVVDHNLVTSRVPNDLPAFNKAFADVLRKYDLEKSPFANATPAQVLEYAITNELKAATLYDNLAKKSKDKLAKAKFKFLAETERSHQEILTELYKKITGGKNPEPRELVGTAGEGSFHFEADSDLLKILRDATLAEDSAYKLYKETADKVKNATVRNLFLNLAEEELSHKRMLEAEYAIRTNREIPGSFEKETWLSDSLW